MKLNEQNQKLGGKNKLVTNCYQNIKSFVTKLKLYEICGKINEKNKPIPDTSNEKNSICKELGFSSLPSASFNVSITLTKTEMNSKPGTPLKTKMNFTPECLLKEEIIKESELS